MNERARANELWLEGDARLASTPLLASARAWIAALDERAADAPTRQRVLDFLDAHPDALLRTCLAGHLTASALVLDARGERVLLGLHAKLGRWLQLGGHCDGDGNLAACALREAREESGIAGLAIDPAPLDLDVHAIPERPDEPRHWHLDLRFLVRAPAAARARRSPESRALGWFERPQLAGLELDDSLRRLIARAYERANAGAAPPPRKGRAR
jgi:8-oxo-dGTP pyrophosphatase MutT (NUDIX family)